MISVEVADHRNALADVAKVVRRVSPRHQVTVDELVHYLDANPQGLLFVATLAGELAGAATAAPAGQPDHQFTMVRVLPESRCLGVGAALLAASRRHAGRTGLARIWGRVDASDEASLRFAAGHGLAESGREILSSLELVRSGERRSPPRGVTVVSLADRPDLIREAYEVERDCLPDVPAAAPMQATSFALWVEQTLEGPGGLPAGTMVALADGSVIGFAGLRAEAGQPGTAEHQLTCVRRAWRGRGVASALKQAQIDWAKDAGLERLTTSNDSPNAAMLAVNNRLGYEPVCENIIVEGSSSTR